MPSIRWYESSSDSFDLLSTVIDKLLLLCKKEEVENLRRFLCDLGKLAELKKIVLVVHGPKSHFSDDVLAMATMHILCRILAVDFELKTIDPTLKSWALEPSDGTTLKFIVDCGSPALIDPETKKLPDLPENTLLYDTHTGNPSGYSDLFRCLFFTANPEIRQWDSKVVRAERPSIAFFLARIFDVSWDTVLGWFLYSSISDAKKPFIKGNLIDLFEKGMNFSRDMFPDNVDLILSREKLEENISTVMCIGEMLLLVEICMEVFKLNIIQYTFERPIYLTKEWLTYVRSILVLHDDESKTIIQPIVDKLDEIVKNISALKKILKSPERQREFIDCTLNKIALLPEENDKIYLNTYGFTDPRFPVTIAIVHNNLSNYPEFKGNYTGELTKTIRKMLPERFRKFLPTGRFGVCNAVTSKKIPQFSFGQNQPVGPIEDMDGVPSDILVNKIEFPFVRPQKSCKKFTPHPLGFCAYMYEEELPEDFEGVMEKGCLFFPECCKKQGEFMQVEDTDLKFITNFLKKYFGVSKHQFIAKDLRFWWLNEFKPDISLEDLSALGKEGILALYEDEKVKDIIPNDLMRRAYIEEACELLDAP